MVASWMARSFLLSSPISLSLRLHLLPVLVPVLEAPGVAHLCQQDMVAASPHHLGLVLSVVPARRPAVEAMDCHQRVEDVVEDVLM